MTLVWFSNDGGTDEENVKGKKVTDIGRYKNKLEFNFPLLIMNDNHVYQLVEKLLYVC